MRRMMALAATLLLGATPLAAGDAPSDPHAFFNAPGGCTGCHEAGNGPEGVAEHEFVVDVSDLCRGCHPAERLGPSHPVDVDPSAAGFVEAVAEGLPVSVEGLITCGTCHNPHLSGRSTMRLWKTQELEVVCSNSGCLRYFKSYYLRVREQDRGFDPLCAGCHAAYL